MINAEVVNSFYNLREQYTFSEEELS